jgi:hypothetical protein
MNAKELELSLLVVGVILLSGCAAQKPKAAIPTQAKPKKEWVCHAGKVEREPTPTGIFLWKYMRLQRAFGTKCEQRQK